MRIACVYAPHVPLQALVRRRPELRKQPVAVASGGPASSVLACSRAAYAMGVRVGMTAIAARVLSDELTIELRDLEAEAQLEAAMVEALYGLSSRVESDGLRREQAGERGLAPRGIDRGMDRSRGMGGLSRAAALGASPGATIGRGIAEPAVQGGLTMFSEVPTGMRGATFGSRVLEMAAALDVAVRVGIADDRFTSWVAARHGGHPDEVPVVAIPRGGSAAFLAPQPLALLDISPEVLQMLVALGVRTLGEFASLPAPSVARRWDCDLQALARGEGGAELVAVKPAPGPLREEVVVGGELSLGAAVALLAERVALRLAGRGGVAAAMEISTYTEGGAESVTLWLVPPLQQAEALADRIGRAVSDGHVQRLGIAVTVGFPAEVAAEPDAAVEATAASVPESKPAPAREHDEGLPEPVTMSGALLRWSMAGNESGPRAGVRAGVDVHRRTRRGKQRRRIVSAQARLFGTE